jgi:catechol 2,3-dioxygenase-like lactoylglutathione lyase family enzyme
MNIDHIVLWVDNQQHSLAFFVDLLGLIRIRGADVPAAAHVEGRVLLPVIDLRRAA